MTKTSARRTLAAGLKAPRGTIILFSWLPNLRENVVIHSADSAGIAWMGEW
jgi:hypothetical protein